MENVLLGAMAGGALAGLLTWLILRIRAAALDERLTSRELRIQELERLLQEERIHLTEAREVSALNGQEVARLEIRLEEERKAAAEKLAILAEAQTRLSDAFRALSSEALKTNNETFLTLAKTTLEKFQEGARGDLETRQTAIDQLVKPVQESLLKFDTKMGEIEKARIEAYSGLVREVKIVSELHTHLRDQTTNLVKALGNPRVRGRWGELQLRRVVEIAGMLEHCDFEQQVHAEAEDGALRPDLIVRLPGGKNIIVDAKTPMDAYLQAIEAKDEPTRQLKLIEHARNVREHMKLLGAKTYWKQFQPTPDFVVLFVPGESFFSAALEYEPDLIDRQIDEHRVIPASPTTLIALLKAASYGWRQEALAENAHKISELGRELFERIVTMSEHFGRVGSSLKGAVENYNKTVASLEGRVLVSARRFRELKASTAGKELEPMAPVDLLPRIPVDQSEEVPEIPSS